MMKAAIIYYSWSGHTRELAKARAQRENADLYEVKDVRKPGKLKAFTVGCFSAIRMKATKTEAFTAPLDTYDRIIIMAPVWAGRPAPAIYTAFDALPAGKEALVCLVSMGGASDCEGQLRTLLQRKECTLTGVENIKS